jgi:hypothetical protein
MTATVGLGLNHCGGGRKSKYYPYCMTMPSFLLPCSACGFARWFVEVGKGYYSDLLVLVLFDSGELLASEE